MSPASAENSSSRRPWPTARTSGQDDPPHSVPPAQEGSAPGGGSPVAGGISRGEELLWGLASGGRIMVNGQRDSSAGDWTEEPTQESVWSLVCGVGGCGSGDRSVS